MKKKSGSTSWAAPMARVMTDSKPLRSRCGHVFDLDGAGADQFVDVGVVDGELHAGAVLEEVGAAVADVADEELAAVDGGGRPGWCPCRVVGAGGWTDGVVGGADGERETDLTGVSAGWEAKVLMTVLQAIGAGDFAGGHAAHAVADDVEVERSGS